jgi:hypothetical protein
MTDDRHRFRPCEIYECEPEVSLLNAAFSPDIAPRRPLPLHAVLSDVCAHTEVLARRLEGGVSVRGEDEREAIRVLYLATRRQLEAIAVALEVLDSDR